MRRQKIFHVATRTRSCWVVKICQNLPHKCLSSPGDCPAQVLKDDFVSDISMKHGFDLHMLVACGGKERTAIEWKTLLAQAGFKLNGIFPSKAMKSVLEAELLCTE